MYIWCVCVQLRFARCHASWLNWTRYYGIPLALWYWKKQTLMANQDFKRRVSYSPKSHPFRPSTPLSFALTVRAPMCRGGYATLIYLGWAILKLSQCPVDVLLLVCYTFMMGIIMGSVFHNISTHSPAMMC